MARQIGQREPAASADRPYRWGEVKLEKSRAKLEETILKQVIERDQFTIHTDCGSSMIAKPIAQLLADIGITKKHSRPHVCNDNPYIETHFHTLKYRPDFPKAFGSYEDAHAHRGRFVSWHNHEYRHSGIGLHTHADVHHGRADAIREKRAAVLTAAYAAHPERVVRKTPVPLALSAVACIN